MNKTLYDRLIKKLLCLPFILCLLCGTCYGQSQNTLDFAIADESFVVTLYVSQASDTLVRWAVHELARDITAMSGKIPDVVYTNTFDEQHDPGIYISEFDHKLSKRIPIGEIALQGEWEKFVVKPNQQHLFIVGSDTRGTVYGIFELAERMGISPWKWWADVKPLKQEKITVRLPEEGFTESPSVQYRGIFLNDEDWGLQPWAAKTFEQEPKDIGPKTYEKIFQLLLRLKANTLWPAMHPSTQAFYTVPGNQEMAQQYHIVIGTSHAEPMLRNNVDEWDHDAYGEYNYFTNRDQVNQYWQERIQEVKGQENEYIITVGMRGIHDGHMEGAASNAEKVKMMETIIQTQRSMLENTLEKPVETIPQVLVSYKEVLELYNAGMQVPEDITLMWTDDNYGYIRRLSNEEEQKRSGGSGVYYHASYWGRPHDYLWLSTTQPGLVWYEMSRAYQNDAKKIWILNVGDIKPGEYVMEFFLDLAWNIDGIDEKEIKKHLMQWSAREFGKENAEDIAKIMDEYYRLAFLRKPEYMGWSMTEPTTVTQPSAFNAKANNNELQRRIDDYQKLVEKVSALKSSIPASRKDAFFQLVEYQVKGAALMNNKFLYAQQALEAGTKKEKQQLMALSRDASEQIVALTEEYNQSISGGKWNHMMSMHPRDLPVFDLPNFSQAGQKAMHDTTQNYLKAKPVFLQASDFTATKGQEDFEWKAISGLGYSHASLTLIPFTNHHFEEEQPHLTYTFDIDQPGEYLVEVRCLPTHSNDFDHQLSLQLNEKVRKSFALNTQGRSEEWKQNVLRNYQSVRYPVTISQTGQQTLKLFVNQTGIVIDQIAITPEGYPSYYEIPLQSKK